MKVVRSDEVTARSNDPVAEANGLHMDWLEGPTAGAQLDVGLVSLAPGGAAPPHSHDGGQTIIVVSGHGFVQTADQRIEIGPGDVVICPPGELHTHGADADGPMAHLTVSTGGFALPPQ
jgi:quercetin dioxygenase-like cupin family protein